MFHFKHSHNPLQFICLIIGLSFFAACTDDEILSIPESPVFVPKSSDTAFYDTGIRPTTNSEGIYLEWFNNTESDLEGYNLFRTTETFTQGDGQKVPVNFTLLRKIPLGSEDDVSVLSDTSYQDFTIESNQRYYYRLTAYSRSGGESTPSIESPNYEIKSYPIIEVPTGEFAIPSDRKLTFKWSNDPSAAGTYIVKIYTEDPFFGTNTIVGRAIIENTGFAGADSVTFDFSTLKDTVIANRTISTYKFLEGDSFGVPYKWYLYFSESAIDQLKGSISESAFSLTN
jgi:hypothetical protein